jgi:mannose-6-phosphate isomerase-like protein (cupin superfamily)
MTATTLAAGLGRKSLTNTYRYAGGTGTILIAGAETGGAFALFEAMQKPGSEPPLHVHDQEDETFYVLEGKVSVWVGGEVHHLVPGDSIFLPRGVPHTFRIKSPVARALNYIAPAGFEEWFRMLGKPAANFDLPELVEPPNEAEFAAMQALAAKMGLRILGPSPEF